MLFQLYAIIALVNFAFLIYTGSAIEFALIKSAIVFAVLYWGTKVSLQLVNIIKEKATEGQESPGHQ